MKNNIIVVGSTLVVSAVSIWAYKLYSLMGDVARYARYWETRSQQPGELVYVAMGDSAAQGIGASAPEKGYVGLLVDSIEQRTGKKVRVINISKSSATTSDVIEHQLPLLKMYKPDIVTIDIGGNDLLRYDKELFEHNIATITAQLPRGTYIADTPYFMHGQWQRNAKEARDFIATQAQEHGLIVAPLHHTMMQAGWGAMATSYAADWFHPNNRGYRDWYNAFWSVMSERLT